jgi:hypothetical protein
MQIHIPQRSVNRPFRLPQIEDSARRLVGREAKEDNMPSSEKKIAANRTNGRKSQGPSNTTLTRHNATKHGLLAEGVTEIDDADGYQSTLRDLIKEINPVGTVEMFLVRSTALEIVRSRRAARLEAEYITSVLHPPICGPDLAEMVEFKGEVLDPGLPAVMNFECARPLVSVFQRYATTSANGLFRMLHELERIQRMRKGENVPAPSTLDVNVHTDTKIVDAVPEELEQRKAGDEESGDIPITKRTQ